mgnify:CR=1 FL=1
MRGQKERIAACGDHTAGAVGVFACTGAALGCVYLAVLPAACLMCVMRCMLAIMHVPPVRHVRGSPACQGCLLCTRLFGTVLVDQHMNSACLAHLSPFFTALTAWWTGDWLAPRKQADGCCLPSKGGLTRSRIGHAWPELWHVAQRHGHFWANGCVERGVGGTCIVIDIVVPFVPVSSHGESCVVLLCSGARGHLPSPIIG